MAAHRAGILAGTARHAMASKSKLPRFDAAAMTRRLETRLHAMGCDVHRRDDQNPFARRFADGWLAAGQASLPENPFGHALWIHVAEAHSTELATPQSDCTLCALLLAHWLPRRDALELPDKHKLRVARMAVRALRQLNKVSALIEHEPAALAALDWLDAASAELLQLAGQARRIRDPELRLALRRGRRHNHLLLSVEDALTKADFDDRDIARLVFGDDTPSIIRAIRDRRRRARARARARGAGGKAPSQARTASRSPQS